MKYVSIDVGHKDLCKRFVIAFPNDFIHADVAEALLAVAKKQWPTLPCKVASAGDMTVSCLGVGGGSTSLKLKSHAWDALAFNGQDYSLNIK